MPAAPRLGSIATKSKVSFIDLGITKDDEIRGFDDDDRDSEAFEDYKIELNDEPDMLYSMPLSVVNVNSQYETSRYHSKEFWTKSFDERSPTPSASRPSSSSSSRATAAIISGKQSRPSSASSNVRVPSLLRPSSAKSPLCTQEQKSSNQPRPSSAPSKITSPSNKSLIKIPRTKPAVDHHHKKSSNFPPPRISQSARNHSSTLMNRNISSASFSQIRQLARPKSAPVKARYLDRPLVKERSLPIFHHSKKLLLTELLKTNDEGIQFNPLESPPVSVPIIVSKLMKRPSSSNPERKHANTLRNQGHVGIVQLDMPFSCLLPEPESNQGKRPISRPILLERSVEDLDMKDDEGIPFLKSGSRKLRRREFINLIGGRTRPMSHNLADWNESLPFELEFALPADII